MPWVELFAALLVAHLAGDFVLQTEFQAQNKRGGLGRDPVSRRALGSHALTYLLAHAPVLAWLAGEVGPAGLVAVAAGIAIPHAVQDDGRLLAVWMVRVKRTAAAPGPLTLMVDQSFHVLALFIVAVAAGR